MATGLDETGDCVIMAMMDWHSDDADNDRGIISTTNDVGPKA